MIVCIAMFGISLLQQNIGIALVTTILAGSILGFLKYNFHPASIFLGDSGAYFLGFILSVLSILSSLKGTTAIAILIPIIALGLPIIDTFLAMFRRLLGSLHIMEVEQETNIIKFFYLHGWSMFKADRGHIHHQLLQVGFTHRKTVFLLYSISLTLGGLALLTAYFKNVNYALLLTAVGIASYVDLKRLGYREIQILRNGMLLPLFDTLVINQGILMAFVDMAIISLSYYLAFLLRFEGEFSFPLKDYYLTTFPLILTTKLVLFYLTGLYKGTWKYADITDLMKMIKGVATGCIASAFLLLLIPGFGIKSWAALIIDFNLLLFFVIGGRSSFRILEHLHVLKNSEGKEVLIYGIGKNGINALKELIDNPGHGLNPMGFIDDEPRNQGKEVNGYPVLGTLDSLETILKKSTISEIILSPGDFPQEKLDRLSQICISYQIPIRRFKTRLEEISNPS